MLIRKKVVDLEAVRVEAVSWNGVAGNERPFSSTPPWLQEAIDNGTVYISAMASNPVFLIKTDTGNHTCTIGDYILRGTSGELYPVKAEVFPDIYDIIEQDK